MIDLENAGVLQKSHRYILSVYRDVLFFKNIELVEITVCFLQQIVF